MLKPRRKRKRKRKKSCVIRRNGWEDSYLHIFDVKLTSLDSIPSGVLYLSVIISQGKLMDPRIYIYISFKDH